MDNGSGTLSATHNLEYLSLQQAASICCVSPERFGRWIDKGALPVISGPEGQLIRAYDLIQHLIRHNIRIPERLLPGNTKKVLFILLEKMLPAALTTRILWIIYRLRQHPSFILDFIEFDATTELKVITFDPDIVFLVHNGTQNTLTAEDLHKMLGKSVLMPPLTADIDTLLQN